MLSNSEKNPGLRWVWGAAIAFFVLTLTLTLHRYYTFYASFDQGIFNQVFWNGLHGNFFQSSLSSTLSTNVVHDGEFPEVSYHRLGQHFTPALLLWLPIYALFPTAATLTVLQVVLVTAGGLVLYLLAREYLDRPVAAMITASYYAANAIIGPTLSNFADNCQIPLFVFTLLLAMEKRWWVLFWAMAACILAVREDGGVTLFGVGVYMALSQRFPRAGIAMCILSFGYILGLTNLIMPLFSEDVSRRFTIERFGQYVESDEATTLELLWAFISKPWLVLVELVTPITGKIRYFLGQWLPFAFIPAIAPASWAIAGFPLLQIFLQRGKSALAINIRYAMAVVPGLCYGTILWWAPRQHLLDAPVRELIARGLAKGIDRGEDSQKQRPFWIRWIFPVVSPLCQRGLTWWQKRPHLLELSVRRFWIGCLCLSILFSMTSNPNRTLYFLIPDSIDPWVHVSLPRQWQHSAAIREFLQKIPPDASVSATTYIVPHLSSRREIVRFPALELRNDAGVVIQTDYAIADLWQVEQYLPAFDNDLHRFKAMIPVVDRIVADGIYGLVGFKDGVIFLERGAESDSEAIARWQIYRQRVEPILDRKD
ncbi:MAG: DUF2079 domain-containing protein [Cyanobacteria bacterium J007]|nr:MAG: DUF2079 domain-containing protein [Cyanobacteria bacterium J007]